MPMLLAIGGLLVSSLFGAYSILDKVEDIQEDSDKTAVNVGTLVLLCIGGLLVWKELSKKK